MDLILDIIQKKQPLIVIIAYALYAYHNNMDKVMLTMSIIIMLGIYYMSAPSGCTVDDLNKKISTLNNENNGLKQNLVQVYQMVQSQQKSHMNEGPPPPENPNVPPPRELPSKNGPPPDEEGKPYL